MKVEIMTLNLIFLLKISQISFRFHFYDLKSYNYAFKCYYYDIPCAIFFHFRWQKWTSIINCSELWLTKIVCPFSASSCCVFCLPVVYRLIRSVLFHVGSTPGSKSGSRITSYSKEFVSRHGFTQSVISLEYFMLSSSSSSIFAPSSLCSSISLCVFFHISVSMSSLWSCRTDNRQIFLCHKEQKHNHVFFTL